MIIINIAFFSFVNFCAIVSFFTKSLTLGILFSTVVRALVAAKLVILGISPLTTFLLALREALVAKLVIFCISSLTSSILALRVFLVAKLVMSGISSPIFFISALYTLLF